MTFLRKDKSKLDLRLVFSMSSAGGTQGGQEGASEQRIEQASDTALGAGAEASNTEASGSHEKREKSSVTPKMLIS